MKHYYVLQSSYRRNTLAVYLTVAFLVIASLSKNIMNDFLPSSVWEEVQIAVVGNNSSTRNNYNNDNVQHNNNNNNNNRQHVAAAVYGYKLLLLLLLHALNIIQKIMRQFIGFQRSHQVIGMYPNRYNLESMKPIYK